VSSYRKVRRAIERVKTHSRTSEVLVAPHGVPPGGSASEGCPHFQLTASWLHM
jgi:hypothetical protein